MIVRTSRDQSPDAGMLPKRTGFTLIELLVVIALIAGLTALLLGNLGAGGNNLVLKSAQAAVAGTFTVARAKAMSSGQPFRVLVNIDPTSSVKPERFLRYLVLQTQSATGWQTITDLYLPEGAYVVPGDFTSLPGGLFSEGTAFWVRSASSTALRSTVLRSSQISTETIESSTAEEWVSFSIGAAGTTAQAGDLVLALGRQRAPQSYVAGESPIELYHRDSVCGIAFSSYGLAILVGDRSGF
jgi:prepilin-type N-terminal cleavage/methylation domain-containing protein